MRAVISPSTAQGKVEAPPSKSMAHRLLICASLSRGESVVHHLEPSQDILATIDCLESLGAGMRWEGSTLRVTGVNPRAAKIDVPLCCRESGSTLRFMIPLCLLGGQEVTLRGSKTLMSRPLQVYDLICEEQGLRLERAGCEVKVRGRLRPGEYSVPGDVSSQFISGLLFALPLLEGESVLHLIPPVESRPYIGMTMQALAEFGVETRWADENTIHVPGNAQFNPRETTVEGDYSNTAFFEALNTLGGNVQISGLREGSLQGDRVYKEHFASLCAGTAQIDVSDCPDLAPVLFVVAAMHHGGRFIGTRRLRYKESNRGETMARELAKAGVRVTLRDNEIDVPGNSLQDPSDAFDSHNDHRVAMALSVLCTKTGGVIEGAEAVNKSFPSYWDKLKSLRVEVVTDGMDQ